MANIIDTLHPKDNLDDNIYPNILSENIPAKAISLEKLDDNLSNLIQVGWDFNPGEHALSSDFINHIYEIKGYIRIKAVANNTPGQNVTMHILSNCIFQIMGIERTGHDSSSGVNSCNITYKVILSGRSITGETGWSSEYSCYAQGEGYGWGNAKYDYQGILTRIY